MIKIELRCPECQAPEEDLLVLHDIAEHGVTETLRCLDCGYSALVKEFRHEVEPPQPSDDRTGDCRETVVALESALNDAQARIAELERERRDARALLVRAERGRQVAIHEQRDAQARIAELERELMDRNLTRFISSRKMLGQALHVSLERADRIRELERRLEVERCATQIESKVDAHAQDLLEACEHTMRKMQAVIAKARGEDT